MKNEKKIILHAPRIHVGGGCILLKNFLNESLKLIRWAQFDARVKSDFECLPLTKKFVKPHFVNLLLGEYHLYKNSKEEDTIISFHGLPPIFSVSGKVIVFCQNRLLLEPELLREFSLWPRIRMLIERFLLKNFWRSSMIAFVQTPSMAESLKQFLGENAKIKIVKFGPVCDVKSIKTQKFYDFVYVANGEPHKNHLRLVNAWVWLSKKGIRPSLALTICENLYPNLTKKIAALAIKFELNVINLKRVDNIETVYEKTRSLIFPSLAESLGLPLLEANAFKLPIIASEKDFVRDSVCPAETFDPLSHLSIARAVMRFMNKVEEESLSLSNKELIEAFCL